MTIDKELEAKILRFHHVERWGVHTIAAQLNVHHSTVDRVLSQAGLPKVARSIRTAVRLEQMARARGYTGGSSHFRARVAQMRPRKTPEAYLRLSTLPGEQSQLDWAHFGHVHIGRAKRDFSSLLPARSHRQFYPWPY